ncbi:MAG: DUF456 domain-containing protein [Gordonia sp. (in: high G+C Gram-positive bacteria)]
MPFYGELLVAAGIVIGLLGIVVPMLPGTIVVAASILVWAAIVGGWAWGFLGLALTVIVVGGVIKYLAAGRVLRAEEIPNRTIVVGGIAGIVGFFVIPVVGLFVGFVLGAMGAEYARTQSTQQAWRGTVAAVKASAITMGIELLAALLAAGIWLGGALVW